MLSPIARETLSTFNDSYERCQPVKRFFEVFYERFTNASPEIIAIFQGKDVDKVRRMANDAFYLIMLASNGTLHAVEKLKRLGELHARNNVPAGYYSIWLDCLISVVEECDQQYDTRVDKAWREVMGVGISIMQSATDAAATPPRH